MILPDRPHCHSGRKPDLVWSLGQSSQDAARRVYLSTAGTAPSRYAPCVRYWSRTGLRTDEDSRSMEVDRVTLRALRGVSSDLMLVIIGQ